MDRDPFGKAAFWDGMADYGSVAQPFTEVFAVRAWREAAVPEGADVLDVATGTGALALVAAAAGARVLATDFSAGMVERVAVRRIPNIRTRVMDGQALDLPDAGFDAAFSMFGVAMFPDWRAGIAEMARVVRPGGSVSVGTWASAAGAATNLLLARLCEALFPDIGREAGTAGSTELADPARLRDALERAGLVDVRIVAETSDFLLMPAMLEDPDRVFGVSPIWSVLDVDRRSVIVGAVRGASHGAGLPVPSTALIATARRP